MDKTRRYWISVTVTQKESGETFRFVPYSVYVDFDQLFRERNIQGRFDRNSVCVKKLLPDGQKETIQYNLSDEFLNSNTGKIYWLIETVGSESVEFIIEYDSDELGSFEPPRTIGLVGVGDCLRFNDGKPHPLNVGMYANPIAIDWDGDGTVDIISSQVYSSTFGSPWHIVRFFRNEGSNKKPLFGEGIPLVALNGNATEVIHCGWCIELADINEDGLLDLIVYPYSGKELIVYLNTGEKDIHNLPILYRAYSVPLDVTGQIICIRTINAHRDGRKSLIVGSMTSTQKVNIDDPLWFKTTETEKRAASWPRWYNKNIFQFYENDAPVNSPLSFKAPVTLKTENGEPISYYASADFEVFESTNGADIYILRHSDELEKGFSHFVHFRQVGKLNEGLYREEGILEGIYDRQSMSIRRVDNAAFQGLLVTPGSAGGRIQYYFETDINKKGYRSYENRGFLNQRNAFVNSRSGYAQGYLCDWDQDGDFDIITGCNTGFVLYIENIGTPTNPMFTDESFVTSNGKIIELLNGPFDDPGSIMEAPLGQTAPMAIDWDLDGKIDLVVVIGKRLNFYKNIGTNEHPIFGDPVEIVADGDHPVFTHRNKPAIVDWNEDGLPDILGHSKNQLLLFKRYRDKSTGELRLAQGIPLLYRDGTIVDPEAWHRYTKYYNVADWKGKGSNDVFLSSGDHILYLENVGTNEHPAFLRPVRLAVDGIPISIGHHVSTPLPVDWDNTGRYDLFVSGESGLFHLFRRHFLEGTHHKLNYKISHGNARSTGGLISPL